jgi:preprotein translocase subunit SecD
MSRLTDSLLGLSSAPARAANTYPLWRYVLIFAVVAVGAIYALPNLYPPDYALQIRAEASDAHITPAVLERATQALERGGIAMKGTEIAPNDALIRVTSASDQLRGRDIVQAALHDDASKDQQFVVALNLAPTTPQWLQDIGGKPMSYGLDLSGGVHFLLEVDMPKAINDRMHDEEAAVKTLLREKNLRYVPVPDMVTGTRIDIGFYDIATRDAANSVLADKYGGEFLILTRDVDGRPGLWLTMRDKQLQELESNAIQRNLESLRNRVNELGVSEPLVQRLGTSRIVVDLPGIQDSADAKRILNKFANLDFRLVAAPDVRPAETESYQYEGRTVVLERRSIVTGDRVTGAQQDYDPQSNLPQVSITLDSKGGEDMNDATKGNVGRQMAILYKELKPRSRLVMKDGKQVVENYSVEEKRVINVATIRSALGYRFRITGLGLGEARDLALLLRAGALAAPMYIVEERTVGASLGEQNIREGTRAGIIGLLFVVVFMVIAYKVFGVLANVALVVNVVLLVAVMSVLGATLTMPGIAGIVLTMGMAVDSNIIIFARIKEELANRGIQAAISNGFDRAFLTILDANLTTFIIAVILFAMGSGPVKGFAVTLAIGIATTVFTAVTVTRALVNVTHGGRNLKKLYI